MDLVWTRELVFSLDFRRVTRVLRILGLEGNNSRFWVSRAVGRFQVQFSGSRVRESICIHHHRIGRSGKTGFLGYNAVRNRLTEKSGKKTDGLGVSNRHSRCIIMHLKVQNNNLLNCTIMQLQTRCFIIF